MGEYREPVQTRADVEAIRGAAAKVRSLQNEFMLAVRRNDHRSAIRVQAEIRKTRESIIEKYKIIL